ncbi:cadherin-13 isoform X4 [Bubalus bubalis]|uniref:cadherin-13 isoform X4 n=1 Tax=Bubalus bubalis TaxID=89462 RepID=UPI001E1B883B|nr:cadherin-13 isoform X4 [Bubalus bubalis]
MARVSLCQTPCQVQLWLHSCYVLTSLKPHSNPLKYFFLSFILQVLLLTSAEDLDCTPGFQQKVFHIDQPAEFIEDQAILNLTFSDCKGNDKLHYEVSSPYFKVNNDGSLVALRNITAVGKTLFVHARTPHAEDMAELVIVGGKDIQGSLQDIFKFARTSPVPRQKRSIVVSPILIPENQRQPFPRDVGKVVDSDRPEGSKFRLTGKGVDQEPKGIFRINENTGSVSVTRNLDRETIATYQRLPKPVPPSISVRLFSNGFFTFPSTSFCDLALSARHTW